MAAHTQGYDRTTLAQVQFEGSDTRADGQGSCSCIVR
jgi:hypothetical protein